MRSRSAARSDSGHETKTFSRELPGLIRLASRTATRRTSSRIIFPPSSYTSKLPRLRMSNPALAQSIAHCLTLIFFFLEACWCRDYGSLYCRHDLEPGKVFAEQIRHAA